MPSGEQDLANLPVDKTVENDSRTNLIVNYLPQSMRDNELFSMFVTMGPIRTARVATDRATDYSFGYGFVDFENPRDAARALEELNGLAVQNKRIKVSYCRPKTANMAKTNLYVCNLGAQVTEDLLEEIFGPYGNIINKNILRDHRTGVPRGVAFVRFSCKEEADAAINDLNGSYTAPGGDRPIEVRVAEEHGKQKAGYFAMASGGRGGGGGAMYGGYQQQQQNYRFNPMGRGGRGGGGGGRGGRGGGGFYRGNGGGGGGQYGGGQYGGGGGQYYGVGTWN